MRVKYNRVSTLQQSGDRFSIDPSKYDITFFDKVSGKVPFKERPKGIEIVKLVEAGEVTELICEDYSRLGRNTGDVISNLEWLDEHNVNVHILNLGLQSRPNGKKNPIWKMISSVIASMYEMELENIKERTMMGRKVYINNGGVLGRPTGSMENEKKFIEKEKTKQIIKYLKKKRPVREISKLTSSSNKTIVKTKRIAIKYGLLAV